MWRAAWNWPASLCLFVCWCAHAVFSLANITMKTPFYHKQKTTRQSNMSMLISLKSDVGGTEFVCLFTGPLLESPLLLAFYQLVGGAVCEYASSAIICMTSNITRCDYFKRTLHAGLMVESTPWLILQRLLFDMPTKMPNNTGGAAILICSRECVPASKDKLLLNYIAELSSEVKTEILVSDLDYLKLPKTKM